MGCISNTISESPSRSLWWDLHCLSPVRQWVLWFVKQEVIWTVPSIWKSGHTPHYIDTALNANEPHDSQQGKVFIATWEKSSDCTFVMFLIKQVRVVTNYHAEWPEMRSTQVIDNTYIDSTTHMPHLLFLDQINLFYLSYLLLKIAFHCLHCFQQLITAVDL